MRLWASSTTDRRCGGGLQVLAQHLGAALGHVAEDRVAGPPRSTPRSASARSFWSTSRSSSWMSRSVEDDDVVEGEELLADLVGQLAVGLGDRLEHGALGRAAGAVEDLGQRVDAAGLGELLGQDVGRASAAARARRPRRRPGWCPPSSRCASRRRPAVSGGSAASTWAPSVVCREATTSAIVCGASSAQERRDLLGRGAAQEVERAQLGLRGDLAEDLLGALGAEQVLEDLARELGAAHGELVGVVEALGELLDDGVGRRRP